MNKYILMGLGCFLLIGCEPYRDYHHRSFYYGHPARDVVVMPGPRYVVTQPYVHSRPHYKPSKSVHKAPTYRHHRQYRQHSPHFRQHHPQYRQHKHHQSPKHHHKRSGGGKRVVVKY